MSERFGSIYGLECACHPERGIRYIGQTVSPISTRRNQHVSDAFGVAVNRPLHNWIRKHAEGQRLNIKVVEIEGDVPEDRLDEREIFWIAKHETLVPNGLNVVEGGGGMRGFTRPHTEEWKARMSAKAKGRKPSQSSIEGVRRMMQKKIGENNYNVRLTEPQVEEIISLIFVGVSPMKIAKDFSVDHTTIYQIRNNKTWLHVQRPIGPRPKVSPYRT